LGVACQGIVNGLINNDIDVILVLPRSGATMSDPRLRVIDSSGVLPAGKGYAAPGSRTGRLKVWNSASELRPYDTLQCWSEETGRSGFVPGQTFSGSNQKGLVNFASNYGKNLLQEVLQYGRIGGLLGEHEDFDIIHSHDWLTIPAGIAAKKASGKPLVVHIHATEFDRNGENMNRDIYGIEKAGLAESDKVIAVSQLTKRVLVERYGVPADKIEVVYNSISPHPSAHPDRSPRPLKGRTVLFIGRVTMQKGPEYFLEAAHRVLKRMADVRFVMAGSGDMLTRMISRMARLRISRKFHFTGFLRGADIDRMYGRSDLFVMPSVSEPFGLTALEALSFDIPVILSKQSGVSEMVPEAMTVDFWDVEKLTAGILHVLSDPVYARSVVARCRSRIMEWSWEKAGAQIGEIYRNVQGCRA
jgi:glycosyltransferase involved in cell wall biosynthesis